MSPVVRLWGIPVVVTVATLAALLVGLVADGPADVLAWLGTSVPVVLTIWHAGHAVRRRPAPP